MKNKKIKNRSFNMATLQDILSGNFPAAQRFAEGYAQMPSYLQDPYLGLSSAQAL